MVQLNGRSISLGTKVPLTGGDEVIFNSCGNHAYIFQHPLSDKVPKTVPSSAISLIESPVASVKRIRTYNCSFELPRKISGRLVVLLQYCFLSYLNDDRRNLLMNLYRTADLVEGVLQENISILHTPHHPISAAQFSIGQSKHCNLWLKYQPVSKVLCKLRRLEQGGPCELEVLGKKGMVQLNGRSISSGTKVPLTGGDEVIFNSCGNHAYIFQHPLSDKVPKTVPSSAVSLIESPVASVKRIRTYKRTGDTSAIALAVHFSTCCRGLARRDSLVKFCQKHGICVTAHTPLGGSTANAEWFGRVSCLDDPVIKSLAEKYGKTLAQLVLRWGLQRDTVVIPKTSKVERLQENFDVFGFDISGEDMERMKAVDRKYWTNQPAKLWASTCMLSF
ncbi:hypothetical protein ZEAMMB73_Zm00001d050337 [Zea mays]|uniref:NADP-dependent oxidoreductase domain-containing protein n=1 Tax=Zea mays TaxID=4577 RepID=A0A1D6Q178_MAIZE|nr:hypothetical protein ZEAMMB73_Zm00001d050337 [Zea mays]